MINIGTKSLKGLEFFSKKEKKQDKTKVLIQIIEKIEKGNPEKEEKLQDIKIDIIENIPLTNEKKTYLKKEINFFKNARKNPKQEMKEEELKIEQSIPEFKNTVNACTESLDTLEQIIKKIAENVDVLYQETETTKEENKIDNIKEKNNILQNNLRSIISHLYLTHTEILNQISKAKSLQTKMAILDNELDLRKDCMK